MDEDLKRNVMAAATWMRALYMLLFAVIFYVAEVVLAAVAVVQLLIKLFTGAANQHLRTFGEGLAVYFSQLVAFLTFLNEDMPFPFAPWPGTARATPGSAAEETAAGPSTTTDDDEPPELPHYSDSDR